MTESTPLRFALEGAITINTAGPVNTSGTFCDLFTGTHPIAGKVALKKPRGTLCTDALMGLIEIEAGVWIKMNHQRILRFLGLYTVDEVTYFVSPFAEFGSLPSYLQMFANADRGRLIVEIAEGLAYLHQFEPGIIHGDVKGHNVLIASDHHARLCDFGLARHADAGTATALKGAGSLRWQSPEILGDGVSKSLQSDVYAFGITIYEVLSGKVPYCDCPTPGNIIKGVLLSNLRPPLEPSAAPDGTSYMRFWIEATKCWTDSPAERPSMADVLRALSDQIVEPETVISQPSIRNGSQEDVSSLATSVQFQVEANPIVEPETTISQPSILNGSQEDVSSLATLVTLRVEEPLSVPPVTDPVFQKQANQRDIIFFVAGAFRLAAYRALTAHEIFKLVQKHQPWKIGESRGPNAAKNSIRWILTRSPAFEHDGSGHWYMTGQPLVRTRNMLPTPPETTPVMRDVGHVEYSQNPVW